MKKIKLNKKLVIMSIIVIIVLAAVGYNLFIKENGEEIVLEKVVIGTVVKEISETGTVKASEEADLSFKSTGKIQRIYVEVGDVIKSGQALVILDAIDLSIQLEEAKAAIQVAKAKEIDAGVSLKNAKQDLADAEIKAEEDLNNAYEDALAVLDDAKLKLYNTNNVSISIQRDYFTSSDQEGIIVLTQKNKIKNAFENTTSFVDSAKAGSREDINIALSKVKNDLSDTKYALEQIRGATETISYRNAVTSADKTSLDNQKSYINTVYTDLINAQQTISTTKVDNEVNINSVQSDITSLEAQLNSDGGLYPAQASQAQANISILENQIRETTLRSPANGQITKVEKREGETVSGAETVISFLPLAPFKVEVDIYEEDIVSIEVGNPVKISLVAFPDEIFEGKVISIDPSEKLIDGVVYYEVNIDFNEVKEGTKIGMTADIAIETHRKENVLIISEDAIKKINGKRIVQVMRENKLEEQEIKIGLEGDDFVEIVSGLKEGEEIVIE